MLQSFYSRLSPRCGRKRAIVALGHRLLRVIYYYYVLLRSQPYQDSNRGSKAVFRYLTTVPDGTRPFLFVEVLEQGLQVKFKMAETRSFGAPSRWALAVGLGVCLLVLVAVGYRPTRWGTGIAMLAGLMILPIGGSLWVLCRTVKRIVLQ
jgi:hypothetical protein